MAWFCDRFAKNWLFIPKRSCPASLRACLQGEVQLYLSMAAPCTHPAISRLGYPAGRSPACWSTTLHCCSQKASESLLARGRQLWLSEGFTPPGLSQAYPITALDLSNTSWFLILPGRPLVVVDTSSVLPQHSPHCQHHTLPWLALESD